ncbi:hypothetical protein HKCCE2091_06770 [Rhodobacterales bacterium HKCCE2091]|nr:hypothetical protein [Rhodobacterales bacterium HKCCE2091]
MTATATLMTDEPETDAGLTAEIDRLVSALEAKVAGDVFETVDGAAARRLMAALVKVYALRTEAGERGLPLAIGDSGTNATDLMITASAILKAGDLEVFELGMWQSYTRFV